ncbi:CAP domain-containing protein [Ferruginibacter sp. SUN002]|uniref:CAP domain-containing protein n=1 Tax=Ferruginibacter sp. SUN002 TaxID=2937789 RepID=UPI003D36F6AB
MNFNVCTTFRKLYLCQLSETIPNMKIYSVSLILIFACVSLQTKAQDTLWKNEKLNTAKDCKYMEPQEREMIYELNRLRSDPPRYAKEFVKPMLDGALRNLKEYGKGDANYSLTTSYVNNKPSKVDTTWHYINEEEVKACQTLYDSLLKMKPLSILLPDEGIYNACIKHAKDQGPTNNVNHQGRDGSWPWERVTKYSPKMRTGNENIAYNSDADVRTIVLQLLVDTGIPGYGHRYNTLNAEWTHVACYYTRPPVMKSKWWIQEYGAIEK